MEAQENKKRLNKDTAFGWKGISPPKECRPWKLEFRGLNRSGPMVTKRLRVPWGSHPPHPGEASQSLEPPRLGLSGLGVVGTQELYFVCACGGAEGLRRVTRGWGAVSGPRLSVVER